MKFGIWHLFSKRAISGHFLHFKTISGFTILFPVSKSNGDHEIRLRFSTRLSDSGNPTSLWTFSCYFTHHQSKMAIKTTSGSGFERIFWVFWASVIQFLIRESICNSSEICRGAVGSHGCVFLVQFDIKHWCACVSLSDEQVSAVADRPARRGASRPPCCTYVDGQCDKLVTDDLH